MQEGQNFEREAPISDFIGLEQDRKASVEKQFKEMFLSQEAFDEEREKTPEEKEALGQILDKMPSFIKKYGGKYVSPTQIEHVHFVSEDDLHKALDSQSTMGAYNPIAQTIYVADQNISLNISAACHELFHLNSFQSLWFREHEGETEKTFQQRRIGFEIYGKDDGETVYFSMINEAITEELNIRFQKKCFSEIPVIERERERKIKAIEGTPVLGKEMLRSIFERQEKGSYLLEREKLNEVISAIFDANTRKYQSRENVFDEFAKAYFTGNLLIVSKLIEKTFGKGSFRKLGEETKRKPK